MKLVFQITSVLFIMTFLVKGSSEHFAKAQVTITPGTNEQAQEEPEPEQTQQTGPTSDGISQKLDYAHFIPLTNSPGNQVKLLLNYTVEDPSFVNEPMNAVMELYSANNQSLLKTSSFPKPIIANQTGKVQLATTFTDDNLKNVRAEVTFTGPGKMVSISNPITVDLRLGQIIER